MEKAIDYLCHAAAGATLGLLLTIFAGALPHMVPA